jgi:multiple sugar transport system ATP-binding protein
LAPRDRDIAMVFQNYALYPHMSVYDNMSFGLRLRYGGGLIARGLRRFFKPGRAAELNQRRGEIDQQVRRTAARLGIEPLLNRKPFQLSGGERQRVALGRAIVRNPAAFLFDEPLSNLDAKLRGQMRVELRRLHAELGATIIHVTHDQTEAMTLGDRVAVMNGGRILQIAPPMELYHRPADLFVAQFIGSVPINVCRGRIIRDEQIARFEGLSVRLRLDSDAIARVGGLTEAIVGFRSEDAAIQADGGEDFDFSGRVIALDRLGDAAHLHLIVDRIEQDQDAGPTSSSDVTTETFVVRLDTGRVVSVGDRLRMKIRPGKVLWFDAATGRNLRDRT